MKMAMGAILRVVFLIQLTLMIGCGRTETNGDCTPNEEAQMPWYLDIDGDGYGDPAASIMAGQYDLPNGYVSLPGDCNDNHNGIYPGAVERCDDIDNNCNKEIDEGVDKSTWYSDADNDGFGAASSQSIVSCAQPDGAYAPNAADCNDTDPHINPNEEDKCDGIDNDCDGGSDNSSTYAELWHRDYDGDSKGTRDPDYRWSCSQPSGYVDNNSDCNDTDPTINYGAAEICDDKDNNCDNKNDNVIWYPDVDGDTWGDAGLGDVGGFEKVCPGPGSGYATRAGDCNDTDPTVYPGTPGCE